MFVAVRCFLEPRPTTRLDNPRGYARSYLAIPRETRARATLSLRVDHLLAVRQLIGSTCRCFQSFSVRVSCSSVRRGSQLACSLVCRRSLHCVSGACYRSSEHWRRAFVLVGSMLPQTFDWASIRRKRWHAFGAIKVTRPDFQYHPIAEPEELGNGGRVRWVSGRPDEAPAYAGTDFIIARADLLGRRRRVP